MPARHSYLALDQDHALVADWFASLRHEVTVSDQPDRIVYYFRKMALASLPNAGDVDQHVTPLVFIVKPQKRLTTLWTDSEVLFTPKPLKSQFPELDKINKAFVAWLKQFNLVFTQKSPESLPWKYYLEGGIQNVDQELYALPQAMEALRGGQYFVHHADTLARLNTVAKTLRLRGYDTVVPSAFTRPLQRL